MARIPFKDYVYSPIQHAALWLGSWLYGAASVEDVEYALVELYGPLLIASESYPEIARMADEGTIGGGNVPDADTVTIPETHEEVLRLLSIIRGWRASHGGLDGIADAAKHGDLCAHEAPALVITLNGPGIPGAIPLAGRDALARQGVPPATAAIQVLTPTGDKQLIVCFVPFPDGLGHRIHLQELPFPPVGLSYQSPGEADQALTQAVRNASEIIDRAGGIDSEHPQPRLLVGSLNDHYDVAGLPPAMPPRAEKLIARADRVSAIIEAVADRLGNHTYDPQLISLWRPLLVARETAVSYSLLEWGRRID